MSASTTATGSTTATLAVHLSLRPDLERERGAEALALRAGRGELRLTPGGGVERIVRELEVRRDEDALRARALEAGGTRGLMLYQQLVSRLEAAGFLRRTLVLNGATLLDLEPVGAGAPAPARTYAPERPARLSRFALIRRDDDTVLLESPLGMARVRLHGEAGGALVGALLAGTGPEGIGAAGATEAVEAMEAAGATGAAEMARAMEATIGLAAGEGSRILAWLDAAALLSTGAEETDPWLRSWELHDLYFHARSRLGRRIGGYGGTYRFRGAGGAVPEPPVLRPSLDGFTVTLPRAPLEELGLDDVPFTRVVEERRSIREQGDEPMTLEQLGHFLYRSARVREHVRNERGEVAHRVYPAGGALYEIELYPVVDRVEGLESGLWRYDPLGHRLEHVTGRTPEVERLLMNAHYTVDRRSHPQVLLILAARFQRMQWKYEGMAYAAILKHVGVLFEAFYLTATAMGLAPCALGGGDADLFARASGLPWLEEGAVGEFVLGSRPDPTDGQGSA